MAHRRRESGCYGFVTAAAGRGNGAVRAGCGRVGGVSVTRRVRVPEGVKIGLLVAGFFAVILAADLLFALLSAYPPGG